MSFEKFSGMTSKYVDETFKVVEDIEVEYDEDYLILGRDKFTGKPVGIDASDAQRVLMIAIAGSGKSFLLRSFMDRAIRAGQSCVIPNDCKDEFKSSQKPLQKKFRKYLLPNEKPCATKIVTLRPTFFKKLLPTSFTDEEKEKEGIKRYSDNFWYSPDIQKMTEVDFSTLFNVHTMSPIQQGIMDDFFEIIKEKSEKKAFNFQMLFDTLQSMDISEGSRQSLGIRMKPIKKSYFHEQKWERSIVELLEKGFVPAINFENFDKLPDTGLSYPQAVMFMVLREVVDYMRNPSTRKFHRLWVLIDEGARFFPNEEGNKLSHWLGESYELDRRYGISFFYATQTYATVPEKVKENSRYVLLSGRAGVDLYKQVMRDFGCFRYLNQLTAEAKRLKAKVNAKNHEWVLFDRDGVESDMIKIFKPLPPLSWHMETGEN